MAGTRSRPGARRAPHAVTVDPRVELLAVVLKLSGYGELYPGRINDEPSAYVAAVDRWFERYAQHKTIRFFRTANRAIAGDLPVNLVLYLTEPPGLAWRTPFPPALVARAGGPNALKPYVEALRAFARDTAFADFFRSQRPGHAAIAAAPRNTIRLARLVQTLESYFGARQRGYHVILAPLLKTVAFGPRVAWKNGALETYCVFPAAGVRNDRIRFREGAAARSLLLHEFSHSFVNPLVAERRRQIAGSAALMRRIRYKTGAAYGTEWEICVCEHLVRAVTTRLAAHEGGEQQARRELKMHEQQGFIFIQDVCDRLEEYEKNRQRYPTFKSFLPELLDVFKQASRFPAPRALGRFSRQRQANSDLQCIPIQRVKHS